MKLGAVPKNAAVCSLADVSSHNYLSPSLPSQGHKKAVPAEPKPGDRSTLTPAQKKEADAKAMKEKMERKAAEAAAGGDAGGGGGGGGKKGGK